MSRLANPRKTLTLEEISDRMFVRGPHPRGSVGDRRARLGSLGGDLCLRREDRLVRQRRRAREIRKAIRAWASAVLSTENFPYPQYQHYCTNFRIRVDGDAASCRHLQIIPISVVSPGGGRQIAFSGIWFEDELVRTAEGWKIRARKEFRAWQHNFPATFEVPKA